MPGPKKGTMPSLMGVPGTLVDQAPEGLEFGLRRLKTSPYDPLLLQLQRAGNGKFLRFDDLRAKVSLAARAKKLNIKILFGEQGTTLWVTLQKADLSGNGHVAEPPAAKAEPLPDIVLRAIRGNKEAGHIGRDTPGLIATFARVNGAPDVTMQAVDRVIHDLARAGKVKLKPVRNKTDMEERWTAA